MRLPDSSQLLAAMLSAADDEAFFATDPEGLLTFLSVGAERMTGWTADEVLGRDTPVIFHDPDELADLTTDAEPGWADVLSAVATSPGHHRSWTWLRRDGVRVPVTLSVAELHDESGAPVGHVGVATDATDRIAAAEAARANVAKSEFLSRMSHELRTPLNAILGFAQVLDMDDLDDDQRDSVQQILRGGRHLLSLINEVLDISRIESGRISLSIEAVPVIEVIEHCVELVRPLAGERSITVTTEGLRPRGLHVQADRQRLQQVLLNLLSNAVKYSDVQGAVRLELSRLDSVARISVVDQGRGISAAMLPRLFTPFDRLGAEQTAIEGVGLGLALSRRLAEAMNATIGVESSEGEGSTFWIDLSLADSPLDSLDLARLETEVDLDAQPSSRKPMCVLYIEDNVSNMRLVERVLSRRMDIKLLSAMTGGLGLSLAREHHPALILLDVNLPDINGDEVLRRLKSDPRTATIEVVVASADATSKQIDALRAQGARAYLTKPLDLRRLIAIVEQVLEEQRLMALTSTGERPADSPPLSD